MSSVLNKGTNSIQHRYLEREIGKDQDKVRNTAQGINTTCVTLPIPISPYHGVLADISICSAMQICTTGPGLVGPGQRDSGDGRRQQIFYTHHVTYASAPCAAPGLGTYLVPWVTGVMGAG